MAPAKTLTCPIPISQRRLERFMKSYESWGEDVIGGVRLRAHTIVHNLFPENDMNGSLLRIYTLMLYYEVLEHLCRAEKKKPEALCEILTLISSIDVCLLVLLPYKYSS